MIWMGPCSLCLWLEEYCDILYWLIEITGGKNVKLGYYKRKVESDENVHTFTMTELRDAAGKDKLGRHVCTEIAKSFMGWGSDMFPRNCPQVGMKESECLNLERRLRT